MRGLSLIGHRYGRLTVIREMPRQGKHRMWRCLCECSKTVTTRQARLRSGETKSCGCIYAEHKAWFAKHRDTGMLASYQAVHARVRFAKGPASKHPCVDCEEVLQTNEWSYIRGCPDERMGEQNDGRKDPLPYCLHLHHYTSRCQTCHDRLDRSPLASARRLRTILLGRM